MTRNSIIYLASCLLGLLLLSRSVAAFWSSCEARHWPVAKVLVTESQAGWVKHRIENHKGPWSYELRVRYVYAVHGQEYSGVRIRFSPWGLNENFNPSISSILQRYPVGTRTQVYFDPRNPSISVLEPSPILDDWIFALAGLALLVLGAYYGRGVQSDKAASQEQAGDVNITRR